jgi:UDP-N-acetylmuramate--alanine ligase
VPEKLDLRTPGLRIHVVGIGGAGMSAIATVLTALGHHVTGSDLKASPALDRLRTMRIDVQVGHAAEHVGDADVVTFSTAIPASNPELEVARQRGLPLLRRAEMLAAITATRRTVAVAGTHGKTTTSSMLALALAEGGLRPSYIVGGELNETGSGAVWANDSDLLVVEADESDGTFLELGADAAIVTNVEPDHLDHYGSWDALRGAFGRFLAQTPGPKVVCADDPEASAMGHRVGATSYGTADMAEYRMTEIGLGRSTAAFSLVRHDQLVAAVTLPVPGLHNARNGCAALVMAILLGAPVEAATRALARYGGVARRFQFRGERDGITFVDDYGHLPGEVASALAAAASGGWDRIVCVFQPHRFSRTAALWQDFADAFRGADVLIVTDVFGAGEAPRPGITGRLISDAVHEANPSQAVEFVAARQELVNRLRQILRMGDLCMTLGAGDLTTLPDELLA